MTNAGRSNMIYLEYERIYDFYKNDVQRFAAVARRLVIPVKEVVAELDDVLSSQMLLMEGQNVAS